MTRLTDDLLLLEELRRAGYLTDDEFAIAKARVLTGNADTGAVAAQTRLVGEERGLPRQNSGHTKPFAPVNTVTMVIIGIITTLFFVMAMASGVAGMIGFLFFASCVASVIGLRGRTTHHTAAQSDLLLRKAKIEQK